MKWMKFMNILRECESPAPLATSLNLNECLNISVKRYLAELMDTRGTIKSIIRWPFENMKIPSEAFFQITFDSKTVNQLSLVVNWAKFSVREKSNQFTSKISQKTGKLFGQF